MTFVELLAVIVGALLIVLFFVRPPWTVGPAPLPDDIYRSDDH